MIALMVLGVVVFSSFYGYLMWEIFKDAFAPEPKVEARPITIGQWRKYAYTEEAIQRREARRLQTYLDTLIIEAQQTMADALSAVRQGCTQLKKLDYQNLHQSLNEMVGYSWPKSNELVL